VTATRDVQAILRARAQKLAQIDATEAEVATEAYVAFTQAGHDLAVPLHTLLYSGRLRHLTGVPGADACLLGVTALGGHLVSVLDVAALLGLSQRGLQDLTSCLVIRHENRSIGLGAHQLLGIEDIPVRCIKPFPALGPEIPRMAFLPKRNLLLLDLPRILADPRLAQG
jgi:chemotaxis signal transduction protein